MGFENLDNMEESYIAFHASGIEYVMPLADVGQVVAEVPQDVPRIRLGDMAGREECAIVFQDGQGLAALDVEKVVGLVHIPPSCQYELPDRARSHDNRWIAGVAFLEGSRSLCYLLDCAQLRECFIPESA